jgi:non-heme chloroperoxidase
MPPEAPTRRTIVFVHGLWLHAESWSPWLEFFRQQGYDTVAASWPGDAATAEETRRNPTAVAGYGVREIAEHVHHQFSALGHKPILIGHSFGGLLVQNLLGRNLAAAAIAIDPAPIRGVWQLPLSALRASFPVLGNPFNRTRAVSLTEAQFRYAFANAVPEREARELYARCAIPAPGRPLFQAATATFNPWSATAVDTANPERGPLLFTAGLDDHTVPPVLVRSAMRRYRRSPASTELKEFGHRGHSLTIDSGWREIAESCLAWLRAKGL